MHCCRRSEILAQGLSRCATPANTYGTIRPVELLERRDYKSNTMQQFRVIKVLAAVDMLSSIAFLMCRADMIRSSQENFLFVDRETVSYCSLTHNLPVSWVDGCVGLYPILKLCCNSMCCRFCTVRLAVCDEPGKASCETAQRLNPWTLPKLAHHPLFVEVEGLSARSGGDTQLQVCGTSDQRLLTKSLLRHRIMPHKRGSKTLPVLNDTGKPIIVASAVFSRCQTGDPKPSWRRISVDP